MSTRDKLIELVRNIIEANGSEAQIDAWIDELQSQVPHPAVTDLVYYWEGEHSAEAIVDAALSYKPIPLGRHLQSKYSWS